MYGVIQGEIEEEAITLNEGDEDEVTMGTGVYLVQARLNRLVPNVLPIQGKKIKVWYKGVKRQCSLCYGYHKRETACLKKSFDEYAADFKVNNPNIPAKMLSIKVECQAEQDMQLESGCRDEYAFLDESEDKHVEKEAEKKTTEYKNEDIIKLLEDPCDLSTDEKNWLTGQCCETEEEVLTKCRELLKCRGN